jgi:hypothetical protein
MQRHNYTLKLLVHVSFYSFILLQHIIDSDFSLKTESTRSTPYCYFFQIVMFYNINQGVSWYKENEKV